MLDKLEVNGIQASLVRQIGSIVTLNFGRKLKKDGVARTYSDMSSLASHLAFREAAIYLHKYSAERMITKAKAIESGQVAEDSELLESVFLNYLDQRKEHHMSQMFRILETIKEPEGKSEAN